MLPACLLSSTERASQQSFRLHDDHDLGQLKLLHMPWMRIQCKTRVTVPRLIIRRAMCVTLQMPPVMQPLTALVAGSLLVGLLSYHTTFIRTICNAKAVSSVVAGTKPFTGSEERPLKMRESKKMLWTIWQLST